MHPELSTAIRQFRRDQDLALDYIHGNLNIPVPVSITHWHDDIRHQITAVDSIAARDGVKLNVHGFGIDVTHPEFRIDFDYGPHGECDCFDEWRLSLHRHHQLGVTDAVDDPRPLDEWFTAAADQGELVLVRDTYGTFYDPSLPSKWTPARGDT